MSDHEHEHEHELEAQQLSAALDELDKVLRQRYGGATATVTVVATPDGCWVISALDESDTLTMLRQALKHMQQSDRTTYRVEPPT